MATSSRSHALLLCAIAVLAVMIAPGSSHLWAQTAQLSDCQTAYGATPTNAQCTAACNAIGCRGNWSWVNPANPAIQRCTYTATFTPGTPGPWVLGTNSNIVQDQCASNQTASASNALAVQVSDSVAVTQSIALAAGVQAGINNGLVSAGGSLTTTATYQAGTTTTSTVTVTDTCNFNCPACGKETCYHAVFSQTRPATGRVTFQWSGICSPCSGAWVNVGPTTSINVSIGGSHAVHKCTQCALTCPNVPNETCAASATTTTNPCNWNVYP
jgi:hypothetical protein